MAHNVKYLQSINQASKHLVAHKTSTMKEHEHHDETTKTIMQVPGAFMTALTKDTKFQKKTVL